MQQCQPLERESPLHTECALCARIGAALTQRCHNHFPSNTLRFLQTSILRAAINRARSPEIRDNICLADCRFVQIHLAKPQINTQNW